MSYFAKDAYYDPEHFDLTTVGEIEWYDEPYQFDLTALWKHKDGTFYWASDSGCSCPTPFEDYTDLESLTKGTKWEFIKEIQEQLKEMESSPYGRADDRLRAEVADLAGKAAQL